MAGEKRAYVVSLYGTIALDKFFGHDDESALHQACYRLGERAGSTFSLELADGDGTFFAYGFEESEFAGRASGYSIGFGIGIDGHSRFALEFEAGW